MDPSIGRNKATVSLFALMQREVGKRPPFRNSVFDPPKVVDEKPTIPKTVKEKKCCLVTKKLNDSEKESIDADRRKIYELVTTPGFDTRYLTKLRSNMELKKCWKRGMSDHKGGTSAIIVQP